MNLIVLTIVFFFTSQLALAEPSLERITLQLTGMDCEYSPESIERALYQLDGVQAVDGRSIPGHVLVDIKQGSQTGAELAHRIADPANLGTSCRASVMESCITAGHLKVP
jgi:hypothetical protein